jgi:hypothetical protein
VSDQVKVADDLLYRNGMPVDTVLGIDDVERVMNRMLGLHFPVEIVTGLGTVEDLNAPRKKFRLREWWSK